MNILDILMNSQNGAAVQQIGSSVGLDQSQTTKALSALLPALASGFQRNVQAPGGLEALIGALSSGNHRQYLDNPSVLGQANAISDGNGILGHVFGSKDVSRQVAAQAAAQTGISADILKKLLPLVATMMMSAFAQQQPSKNASPFGGNASGGGITDMLGSLLDSNKNGSIVDDVASMLGKFMSR